MHLVYEFVGVHTGQWYFRCAYQAVRVIYLRSKMVNLGRGVSWLKAARFYNLLAGNVWSCEWCEASQGYFLQRPVD